MISSFVLYMILRMRIWPLSRLLCCRKHSTALITRRLAAFPPKWLPIFCGLWVNRLTRRSSKSSSMRSTKTVS